MPVVRSRAVGLWAIVVLGPLLAACGSARPSEVRSAPPGSTSTVVVPSSTSTTSAPPTTTEAPPATDAPIPTTTTPAAPVAVDTSAALDRAGDARQAVVVTAADYGSTTATLTSWQRVGTSWEPVHGPWPAFVGYAGFAPPGEKREGDGRTPSGTFGFEFAFGIESDPGVALPYRRVTGPSIVWDDVPSSPSYNQWVDGGVGEAMYQSPVYDYAAVIAYNTARTPGLGSAIFLHVSRGNPTAGCVSLPVERLLEVLRWLDPARAPVIVMGVA